MRIHFLDNEELEFPYFWCNFDRAYHMPDSSHCRSYGKIAPCQGRRKVVRFEAYSHMRRRGHRRTFSNLFCQTGRLPSVPLLH